MNLEPVDWNVVIVGRWNPAILTPARIAHKLYELPMPQSGPLPVLVPLDGLSPYEVEHPQNGIVTLLNGNQLIIKTAEPTYDSLADAMHAGWNALRWLPETPFSAAGFNIKFRTEETTEELLNLLDNETLDSRLTELSYRIDSSHVKRTVEYKTGFLNLMINRRKDGFSIEYNFHKQSSDSKTLEDWLSIPVKELQQSVATLQEKFELSTETHV